MDSHPTSMTRLLLFSLALSLAACDAEAPLTSAAADTGAPVVLASLKAKGGEHPVSENASVIVEGETVILKVDGREIALKAGEAYLLGHVLTGAGYEAIPGSVREDLPPPRRGGDRCEPPSEGEGVTVVGGVMATKCPPPPPPLRLKVNVLQELLGGSAEAIPAPANADWREVPGGLVAPLR